MELVWYHFLVLVWGITAVMALDVLYSIFKKK